jgi:hypothetical protein
MKIPVSSRIVLQMKYIPIPKRKEFTLKSDDSRRRNKPDVLAETRQNLIFSVNFHMKARLIHNYASGAAIIGAPNTSQ